MLGGSPALACNAERGRPDGGEAPEKSGEVSVHHRNGPFAMISCPGVNNANVQVAVNSVTWLNRRNMQRSAWVSINQPGAARRGRGRTFKNLVRDGYLQSELRVIYSVLYLFTARQGLGAGALHSHSAF